MSAHAERAHVGTLGAAGEFLHERVTHEHCEKEEADAHAKERDDRENSLGSFEHGRAGEGALVVLPLAREPAEVNAVADGQGEHDQGFPHRDPLIEAGVSEHHGGHQEKNGARNRANPEKGERAREQHQAEDEAEADDVSAHGGTDDEIARLHRIVEEEVAAEGEREERDRKREGPNHRREFFPAADPGKRILFGSGA